MQEWVEKELTGSQMQDARHTRRLAQVLERLSEGVERSIPRACQGWGETVAAYRFLDNPKVGLKEILSGHQRATVERVRAQAVVLLVQDTTFLDYGTLQPKAGMGTVKVKQREEYLLHPTVAFTPERVNLGVVGLRMWQRPKKPVAQDRARKPIEEKESYRWLESYKLTCDVQQRCPETVLVNVADREGDIHECFLEAQSRAEAERAEFIIRAKENRRIVKGLGHSYLWPEVRTTSPCGSLTIEVPRQAKRPPHQVTLAVRICRVTLKPAVLGGAFLPSRSRWSMPRNSRRRRASRLSNVHLRGRCDISGFMTICL